MHNKKSFDFFGLRVDRISKKELLIYVDNCLKDFRSIIIFGWSLTVLPKIKSLPEIGIIGNSFDLLLADGKGFHVLCNLLGAKSTTHFSLPDLVDLLLNYASFKNKSVYLFGATSNINYRALKFVQNKYDGIARIGGRDGYFLENQLDEIEAEIQEFAPDFLFIGISSPIKERLAFTLKRKLNGTVIVPCGGVLDIFGGKVKREPQIFKILAMAWLWRFMCEPKRLFKPVLMNGLECIFILIPTLILKKYVLRESQYSIFDYKS
jgi:N-acetylglucosaminyldiphosphoundecaprenol N-acetyl-beta-D-mannosaminyltransferase